MTDAERKEINPEFCVEGLRYILHHYANYKHPEFSTAEASALVGAIMLIRNKKDDWCYQPTSENWKMMKGVSRNG